MKSVDKISLIIKYPKGAPGNKLNKVGGLYFRIRAAGQTDYTQVATGLQASLATFDLKKKEFNHRALNASESNVKIKDQESALIKKMKAGFSLKRERLTFTAAANNDVTFKYIVTEYKRRAEEGLLRHKKNGLPLAPDTIATIVSVMSLADQMPVDFNFTMYNAATGPAAIDECGQFITRLVGCMSDLDPSTQSHRCVKIKQAITTMCKVKGIHLGDLLDDLKVSAPDKEVETIDKDQVRYCLNNYHHILTGTECNELGVPEAGSSRTEEIAFDYFVVAIMLCPRKMDMDLWSEDNLYADDKGRPWIKYKPNKTKNVSSKWLNVPVPPLCMEIFEKNIARYGKLMAPWNSRVCQKLRDRAERMPIFQKMVQTEEKGKIMMVPQWRTLIIHMGRASGTSDKASNGVEEAYTKEWTGHVPGSVAFKRYMKMQKENMADIEDKYQKSMKSA